MINEAIQFYRTISAWFGEGGKPVPRDQAEHRASVCSQCPLNLTQPIWEGMAAPVALLVRRQLALKNKLNLNLGAHEHTLNTCQACGCILKLKVWQPLPFVLSNLQPDQRKNLWRNCWILEEEQDTR